MPLTEPHHPLVGIPPFSLRASHCVHTNWHANNRTKASKGLLPQVSCCKTGMLSITITPRNTVNNDGAAHQFNELICTYGKAYISLYIQPSLCLWSAQRKTDFSTNSRVVAPTLRGYLKNLPSCISGSDFASCCVKYHNNITQSGLGETISQFQFW